MTTDKVERAIARFDRITQNLDARSGGAAPALRRERQRRIAGYGRALSRATIAAAVIIGGAMLFGLLVMPLEITGFLIAVAIAIAVFMLLFFGGAVSTATAPNVPADLAGPEMVERFDSYIYRARRALPAPAQNEIDRISAMLPRLKEVLGRVETLDPAAQDARRLMSIHLPGLIDRYVNVPGAYRGQADGEGVTLDQRLTESLGAGRAKLEEVADNLARGDIAAFETQGRFIQSRYGETDPTG